jgi:hypothetical protein
MKLIAYVSNLGRYTEGHPLIEPLPLPANVEQTQGCLRRIGVDGKRYEEIHITEYTSSIPSLPACLGEHENLDELNYLAGLLSALEPDELEKFTAAIRHGEYAGAVPDLINLAQNLDCYELLPQVKSYEDYGLYLVDDMRDFTLPQEARHYFDFAAYGECAAINDGGELTPQGYIYNNRSLFTTYYDGETIPSQYRIFVYPPTMKKHLKYHKEKPRVR